MDEQNKNAFDAHDRNSQFALKALMTVSAGGLLATSNFYFKALTSEGVNQKFSEHINSCVLDLLSCSYILFLISLIAALFATIFTYFANRQAYTDVKNTLFLYASIITGVLSFIFILLGLISIGLVMFPSICTNLQVLTNT